MSYWVQLKLILWKNFLLRKRQKKRCLVELIWPLFLFLILMWVRTRGLRSSIHECYFTEKAMPSVGPLPFLQSFVCTFNNTCHRYVNSSAVQMGPDDFNFRDLVHELWEIFKDDTLNNDTASNFQDYSFVFENLYRERRYLGGRVRLKDVVKDPESLYETLVANNTIITKELFESILDAELKINRLNQKFLGQFFRSPKEIICGTAVMREVLIIDDNVLEEFCKLSNEDIINFLSLLKDQLTEQNLDMFYFLNELPIFNSTLPFTSSENHLREELTNYTPLLSNITFPEIHFDMGKIKKAATLIQFYLCGNQSSDFINQLFGGGGRPSRFDSLQDQFRERTRVKYNYDNDTTVYCNKLFQEIEEIPPLHAFWRIVKPFIRGKILFTPVTPATQRVMEEVNKTFVPLLHLRELSRFFPDQAFDAGHQIADNSTDILRKLSDYGRFLLNSSFARTFLSANADKDIEDALRLIDWFNDEKDQSSAVKFLKMLPTNFSSLLECIEFNKVEGYNDKYYAEEEGMNLLSQNKLWALVEFENPGMDRLSPLTTYKIRMNTERVDNTESIMDSLSRPGGRIRPAIDLKYITYGFAYLQDMIDRSIIKEQSKRDDLPGIKLQQFPYPCYIDDQFVMAISRTFPLFMVLSWVYTCAMIVKSIVCEKEQRLKETMRVMGLGNGIHWLGWFIDSFIPMVVTIFFLTIILVYGNVLMRADPTVVFIFLLVYSLATIAQSFLISVFFSRANIAAACAGIIFFVLYLPYPFMVRWMLYLSSTDKVLLSLFSNVAFGLGASYLSLYEESGTGLHWDDITVSPLYDDDFSLAYVIYMLLLDCIIYLILTWYIEAVFPGQYGIPKPWYFPFTITYWSGKPPRKVFVIPTGDYFEEKVNTQEGADTFEDEPEGLTCGLTISNLSKVYSNGKVAVNDISLNFYEGQITSFLGHNGAGKTTTISILTGLFPPSSGTAKIYGLDIRNDMDKIRNSLGMCPQHNVLFEWLTVEEHLQFYGQLRVGGTRTKKFVEEEGEKMLADLHLPHKRKALASDLSGGMQRKLSIALAFIGGSKTVILDEPTSGVDPYSRRSIWELLLKYKEGRTVILTTHYMDEADLLSDRIAIIANGKLQCCGSSVFLKSLYGSGYHLTVEMDSYTNKLPPTTQFDGDGDISGIYDPHVAALDKHIKSRMPTAQFLGQIGSEVTFVLPPGEDFSAFTSLCDSLDDNKDELHILSYGVSDTSLEEVAEQNDPAMKETAPKGQSSYWDKLLRWLNKHRKNSPPVFNGVSNNPQDTSRHIKAEKEIVVHLNGASVKYTTVSMSEEPGSEKHGSGNCNKNWRQFKALSMKRFQHTKRNGKSLFSELVLPALFVCMSLAVTSVFPTLQERPPLEVEPWLYPSPRYIFYSNDNPESLQMEKYISEVKGPEGLGSLCILIDGKRNSDCLSPVDIKWSNFLKKSKNVTIVECSCSTGAQVCPASIGNSEPSYTKIASSDTLYDMTDQNISSWIINTWPRYAQHRYGGYSFGSEVVVPNINLTKVTKGILDVVKSQNPAAIFSVLQEVNQAKENNRNNIKVWFNNKAWVSSVAYMSAINNVILRASLPENVSSSYGIKTINHPMNFTKKQLDIELIKQAGISLLHAISVIFALSFVPASFTLYIIEERTSNSKHLQLVSGVSRLIYWIQAYVWDMVCYIISALLCIIIFLIFNEETYISPTNFPGLVLLFFLYGWSCIPLMYPISYLFSIPSSAFVGLACANMFVGIITTVTTFVLGTFDDDELRAVDDIIKEVFLIFPHFCLGDGLMKLATNHMASASLSSMDIEWRGNILEWDYIGKNLTCMFILGIIFFAITLAIEFKLFSRVVVENLKNKVESLRQEDEEEDVKAERLRIEEGNLSDILVIDKLMKVYPRRGINNPSVNRISVGIKQGECFGLLGLNGAGKTSTFKMLTGAINVTSGDAYVKGHSIVTDIGQARSLMGYCPQFDALDPLLTPREHLIFYATIRNIPSRLVQKRVDESLQQLGLGHYSNRLAGTLSGGNKRKLSTAIALIGNPPLVFLDEPTSGMDPKARRFLWSRIQDVVRGGSCVVLTSHSMEECQALCTRLVIMVNGTFKCIGSSQHLKNKFGGGYSVVVRCKENDVGRVKMFMSEQLPDSKLTETHYNQLRYQIENCRLAEIFKFLEFGRNQQLIMDYSLSQTTLEEVFIRFASNQTESEVKFKRIPFFKRCVLCTGSTSSD